MASEVEIMYMYTHAIAHAWTEDNLQVSLLAFFPCL